MKLALIHDWLLNVSGGDRVLIELHKMFPNAPIYTLFYDKKYVLKYLPNAEIRPSFLQKIPGITKNHKYLFFLMPTAIESFDLGSFDTVISSSAVFSKGLVLKPKTRHVCYCYSPTRQLWDLHLSGGKNHPVAYAILKHFMRIWDRQASDRVDEFVAISEHVRDRIQKYYRRDAKVIYPPVNNFQFSIFNFQSSPNDSMFENSEINTLIQSSGYYLIVSRLYSHKNIDVAVEAFAKLGFPLVIIGDGPEFKSLNVKCQMSNVRMAGFIPDEQLPYYYQNCRAFIMPQEEDFGITPIEAMSFGKPILALRRGGAIETVAEGVTGEFFDDPIPEALADGIRRLNENYSKYNSETIKLQAQKFSVHKFREEMKSLVYNI